MEGKSFKLKFSRESFGNNILMPDKRSMLHPVIPDSMQMEVVRMYKQNWFRRLMLKLGFKVKLLKMKRYE